MQNSKRVFDRKGFLYSIIAIVLVLVVGAIILFGIILNNDNKSSDKMLFDIKSVQILLDGSKDFGDIRVGSDDLTFGVEINDGEDISKYDTPQIIWGFDGDKYDNSIDNDGTLHLGKTLDTVAIKVTVKSKNELSASASIGVVPKNGSVLQSIEILKAPSKVSYVEGQSFDSQGLVVGANFRNKDGEYIAIINDYEINTPEILTPESSSVEIMYAYSNNTSAITIPIAVNAKSLQYIQVVGSPRVDYVEGQSFDSSSLQVMAFYEYTSLDVSDLVSIKVDEILTTQSTSVEITYVDNGIIKTTNLDLNISPRVLLYLEVDSSDARLEYTQGDIFDTNGLVVTAHYQDQDRVLDSSEYELVSNSRLLVSDTEIFIKYQEHGIEKQASIPITVNQPYTKMININFESEYTMDVSISWRYEYLANDGEQLEIDNIKNDFEVPFGATLTLTALNPSIMKITVDEKGYTLNNETRTVSFVVLNENDMTVEFDETAGNRTTLRFLDLENDIRYITNLFSGTTTLSTREINQIKLIFSESSQNFYNQYYIDDTPYSIDEIDGMDFYSSTIITVVRKDMTR